MADFVSKRTSRIGVNPFSVPVGNRDPVRRLRGRLVAPVTVWTATADGADAGLTVSSVVVSEGERASVLGLVGPHSELWDAVRSSRRFVMHVLGDGAARMADDFAGRHPGPDAPFEQAVRTASAWGPVLESCPTRAYCSLAGFLEVGYSLLLQGTIDEVDVADGQSPLVHYRGSYSRLATS